MTAETPAKKPAKVRKTRPARGKQTSVFDDLTPDQTSIYVSNMVAVLKGPPNENLSKFAPPNSILELISSEFAKKTNIPLEIPMNIFLHYLSAELITRNVTLKVADLTIKPDLWTIVLAESGAGKTYSEGIVAKLFDPKLPLELTGAMSTAAFFDILKEKNRGLWVRDEFAQLLKKIEIDGGNMSELKDLLLRLYDGNQLTWSTKKDGKRYIDDACISILGLNVTTTFYSALSPESLIDGFSQRFGYVMAKTDPRRNFLDYSIWTVDSKPWAHKVEGLLANVQQEYTWSHEAALYFADLFAKDSSINESFHRRIHWRLHKYALLYHVILGYAADPVVGIQAYGWANRLIQQQLYDAALLLQQTSQSELQAKVERVIELLKEYKAKGEQLTPRILIQRMSQIKNAAEARGLLRIVEQFLNETAQTAFDFDYPRFEPTWPGSYSEHPDD